MINKQKLWFVTLFSIILVLSIYYLTMPKDILSNLETIPVSKETSESVAINSSDILTALRIEYDEETVSAMNELQDVLLDESVSSEDKNNAYNELKELNSNKGKEDDIEAIIKEKLSLETLVKIKANQIKITLDQKTHDSVLANNIIRLVQEQFEENKYITVTFKN